MDSSLGGWVADYGYLAVFVGSVLEGESILLLAGVAAHQGTLSFGLVALIAFVGGTLGDQILFHVGRRHGAALLRRVPSWAEKVEPVRLLIRRHRDGLIVGVRFMYGLRLIGPVVIGMSEVPALRFALLNMLGAAIWAPLITWIGYAFGHAMHWLIDDFGRYEKYGLLVPIVLIAAFWLGHKLWHRRRARRGAPE